MEQFDLLRAEIQTLENHLTAHSLSYLKNKPLEIYPFQKIIKEKITNSRKVILENILYSR